MDRVRPAMLIAALVVDVGRRLPRRGGSAVPYYFRNICKGKLRWELARWARVKGTAVVHPINSKSNQIRLD